MMRVGAAIACVVLCLALQGCDDEGPSAPGPVFSGRVIVNVDVRDQDAYPLAPRVVVDPDSVLVCLLQADVPIDSTYSKNGQYAFPGLAPGAYRAAVGIRSLGTDTTSTVQMGKHSVATEDTLELRTLGSIFCYPNPFDPSTGDCLIHFSLPRRKEVTLDVLSIHSVSLGTIVADRILGPGIGSIPWAGRDSHGAELPSGLYVVYLRASTGDPAYEQEEFVIVLLERS
jgi:hypothetical protein